MVCSGLAHSTGVCSTRSTRTSHHCHAVLRLMPQLSPIHVSIPNRTAALSPSPTIRRASPRSSSTSGLDQLCASRSPSQGDTGPSLRKRSRSSAPTDL